LRALRRPYQPLPCTPERIARYRGRVSGPLADASTSSWKCRRRREAELVAPAPGEASSAIRGRVAKAHETQLARQHKPNALLGTREIDRHCATNRDGDQLLRLRSPASCSRRARITACCVSLAPSRILHPAPPSPPSTSAEAIQYRRLDPSF